MLSWKQIENPLGALVGVAFVGFLMWSEARSQQPPPTDHSQPAKSEYQDSRASQTVTNPVAEKQEAERKKEGKWYSTFSDHAPDWFVAIFTGLLVYVTFRLVKSTNRLWEAGERQIAVAESAAQTARDTLIATNRPWMVVTKIVPRSDLDMVSPKAGFSFETVFKNVGNSPATNVVVPTFICVQKDAGDDPHERHRKLREEQAKNRPGLINNRISLGLLVTPGQETSSGGGRAGISAKDWKQGAAKTPWGEINPIMAGQISYTYANGKTQHETGFMFIIRRKGGITLNIKDGIVPMADLEIEPFGAGFYVS